jgi:hypothetical protein
MWGRYVSPDEASIEREFNLVHSEYQFPPEFQRRADSKRARQYASQRAEEQ